MVVVGTFPGEDGGSLRCWAAAHVTAFAMALPGASPKEPTAAKAVAVAPPAAQPAGAKGAKRKVSSRPPPSCDVPWPSLHGVCRSGHQRGFVPRAWHILKGNCLPMPFAGEDGAEEGRQSAGALAG